MAYIGKIENVNQLKSKVQALRGSDTPRQLEICVLICEYLGRQIYEKADRETLEGKEKEKRERMLENERYVERQNKKASENESITHKEALAVKAGEELKEQSRTAREK